MTRPGSPFGGIVKAADELSGMLATDPSSLPWGVATGVVVGVEPEEGVVVVVDVSIGDSVDWVVDFGAGAS